jgi:hypothetical protein
VDEPLRDTVGPLPDVVSDLLMHNESGKTVAIGTVAWVDLWRGVVLCDMLDECAVLRDVPLPPPAMGNSVCRLQECNPITPTCGPGRHSQPKRGLDRVR